MTGLELKIRLAGALAEVPASAWNACAQQGQRFTTQVKQEDKEDDLSRQVSTREFQDNPFVSHEFLSSLEGSRSVGPRTGWQPQHLLLETGAGELIGAAPCYLKTHSRGEYVFDHGWAEA